MPPVQTKETEKFLYGKVRKVTSFLHSGKKKLLMLTLQNTWNNFFFLTAVYEVQWQIISLVHSLILVPALKVHSHTFTLYEGYVSLKVRVMLDTTLWVILWCAGLLCGSPAFSQSYWNRLLPCQCSRQENLYNRVKINGSGVKGQRWWWGLTLPAVPEHLTPKYPTESLHPSFRGRPVAFPLANQRDMQPFTITGKDSMLALPKLAHARHQNLLGLP